METEFELTENGQEVQKDDMNLVAEEAARGTDWLLAELQRPSTGLSGTSKYVIPAGGRREISTGGHVGVATRSLVIPSGSADGSIKIYPFRAIIGALETAVADVKSALRKIRTVGHYGANNNNVCTTLQLATSVNYRWDLLYAKVDIDVLDGSVARFVKSGAGVAGSQNLQVTKQTSLTFGVVQGAEAATPGARVRPSLPSDSGSSYYIALAYISIPSGFTLTEVVYKENIHEVYDTLPISPALGVAALRPANGMYKTTGYAVANEDWNTNGRPKSYLSPGMMGGERLMVALHVKDSGAGTPSVPANTSTLIDSSVDWRRRIFSSVGSKGNINDGFPWGVNPPTGVAAFSCASQDFNVTPQFLPRQMHSFLDNFVAGIGSGVANAAVVNFWTQLTSPAVAAGAVVVLYVDLASGNLMCWRNNVDAGCMLFCLLEASAPFPNFGSAGTVD